MTEDDPHETWRALLGQLLAHSSQRHRLALAVGVAPVTLHRRAAGTSTPWEARLYRLADAGPREVSQRFTALAAQQFSSLFHSPASPQPASAAFYARMLSVAALAFPHGAFHVLADLLLTSIVEQFDPGGAGLVVSIVGCVPPGPGQTVRSLRIVAERGTPPWNPWEPCQHCFGSESACGAVITQGRMIIVPDREASPLLPVCWLEHEGSLVVAPIFCQGEVAGCLRMAAARPRFFEEAQDAQQESIEPYAHLAALLFEPEARFDLAAIRLHPLPAHDGFP